jgi:hypothetical protein
MASRSTLRRELAQAEERLLAEMGRQRIPQRYPSARIIEVQERRVLLLTALLQAGHGHVFTSQTNWADRPSYTWTGADIPSCRHCRAPVIGSLAARQRCPGDRHSCPVMTAPGRPGHPVFCEEPGSMDEGFTAWTCEAGHVTDAGHVPLFRDHRRLCLLADTGCPWPWLAGSAL